MTKRTFMAIITVDDGAFDSKGMSATSEVGMAIDYGLGERLGFAVNNVLEIIDDNSAANAKSAYIAPSDADEPTMRH